MFLRAGELERVRLLDINRRLLRVEQFGVALFTVASAVAVPTFGVALLMPLALAAAAFYLVQSRLGRFSRPELALAGTWLFCELMIALAVAVVSGHRAYLLPIFAFPLVIASVIFPPRAVMAGAGITALLIVGSALGFDYQAVAATPPVLIAPLVVAAVLSMTGSAVRDLDLAARRTAIVDPLTGVLNRAALASRATELAHARVRAGMIVADVDRFKAINDRHGHAVGDRVLEGVARRLREALGPFDLVYRIGGEEFVVLLADTDPAPVAARLRDAIREQPVAGLPVTLSLGVATAPPGRFDFDELFDRADAALYAAKRAGRDQVGTEAASAPLRVERRAAPPGAQPRPRRLTIDGAQREHLLAMSRRLRGNFRRAAAISGAGIAASAPWFGWRTLIAPAVAGVLFNLLQGRAARLRRPEYALASGWMVFQLSICIGFALASHRPLFALPLLTLMVIGSGAMFPTRFTVAGVVLTALLMSATALHIDSAAVAHAPAVLAFPLALLGGVGLIGRAVQRSAVYHRGTRVVDPLTGLLNRAALDARLAELSHAAGRVSVIVGDVDHFKALNDKLGHAAGDAALVEVGEQLRRHVRASESVYRLGGDEFALLLPGVEADAAAEVCERLRDAIRASPIAVTMSFGVAATAEPVDETDVFQRADAALYAAKRAGRDRVRVDRELPLAEAA